MILKRAAEIVQSYDTGVTLRQLFYRLVAAQILPNTTTAYQTLSNRTAAARRAGSFPDLIDLTREIHQHQHFDSPAEARDWLHNIYRRDRTEGQSATLYLGVEKRGIVQQLLSWFGDFGFPIVALGGYSSETYIQTILRDVHRQGRQAVLIYAGDFDPSGEDIIRDFGDRARGYLRIVRIALNADQIDEYQLPEQPGKPTDSRARGFQARHGRLVQVELDALPPDVLRSLYQEAIDRFFDRAAYDSIMAMEAGDREMLTRQTMD